MIEVLITIAVVVGVFWTVWIVDFAIPEKDEEGRDIFIVDSEDVR